jgi:23S rRNA (cytosine1962-C5)-methyltransferase
LIAPNIATFFFSVIPVPKSSPRHRTVPAQRRESRFPLDAAYVAQRPLDLPVGEIPVVSLKSATKSSTIFRKRIAEVDPAARHGDLVRVLVGKKEMIGYGLWNPRAEATVRLLTRGNEPPQPDWWRSRLADAVSLRRDILQLDRFGNAYRLIHAEGDGFPGLVADRFDRVVVLEAFTLGMYQRAEAVAQELASLAQQSHWVVRPGPHTLEQEGFAAEGFQSGSAPEKVFIEEHGVRFEVHPFAGQKTGFFCDQRDNRLRLRDFCAGKSVLDLCSFTGGFALNALRGGAGSVTAVDLDEEAVHLGRRNAQLNHASVKFVHADAFAYMRDMQRNGRQFDVLILDPPKLIRDRDEMAEGQNKYFDLNRLAVSLVSPGGLLLTCSCSGLLSMEQFTLTVRAAMADRGAQLLHRSGAAADHPVSLQHLESEYLKCLWLRVE